MPVRFHLDEHVPLAVASGLRRRGMDVTTTADAGLGGADDRAHLVFALQSRRVIVTQDEDFLAMAASGAPHYGIVFTHQGKKSIGQIIEFLELLDTCMTEEQMVNQVQYF